MIQQVVHTEPGGDPAAVGLALAVAYALHPATARAAEVAPAATTPRRTGRSARARRRAGRG
ncbi:hypothetical protein ADK65_16560 [Streptomyces sp. NRRL B-1140]|uniref:hypothetical protein n=1 Tax=Streptomyces sp. NRRL B-1140 TaxID=1415549 RepID=UPI0006AFAB58|nr:hypothetical protein [Streptomyces sp. NRRL B-1140]KOW00086.1 hypothetical protein ADK65_16560 [Streptomyces sp. NRRL B-1140]